MQLLTGCQCVIQIWNSPWAIPVEESVSKQLFALSLTGTQLKIGGYLPGRSQWQIYMTMVFYRQNKAPDQNNNRSQ